MASSSSKRRGGPIIKFELAGVSLLDAYPACSDIFKRGVWYEYCHGLSGHHVEVSKAFARSFDAEKAEFKSLTLIVIDQSIAEATGLPIEGDKWFKRVLLMPSDFNYLLVSHHKNPRLA